MGKIATLEAGDAKMYAATGKPPVAYDPPAGGTPPYYWEKCLTKTEWLNRHKDSNGSTFVINGDYSDNQLVDIDNLSYKYVVPGVTKQFNLRVPCVYIEGPIYNNNGDEISIESWSNFGYHADDLILRIKRNGTFYDSADIGSFSVGDDNGDFNSELCGSVIIVHAGDLPYNSYYTDNTGFIYSRDVTDDDNAQYEAYICSKTVTFTTTSLDYSNILTLAINKFESISHSGDIDGESYYSGSFTASGGTVQVGEILFRIMDFVGNDGNTYTLYEHAYMEVTVGAFTNGSATCTAFFTTDNSISIDWDGYSDSDYYNDECAYTRGHYLYPNIMLKSEWNY